MNRILHQLRYGVFSIAWARLSQLLIKIGGARLAAYLSRLSIDWSDDRHDLQILCLHRESFIKDIVELRKRTNFDYTVLTAGYTRFQMAWFPPAMQIQTFYQTHQMMNEHAIAMSTEYALRIVRHVQRKKKVAAVLSANFDYWQDLGFKKACQLLGIPFLVLSREHAVVPRACDEVLGWYLGAAYKFEGAAIAVAGASTKNVLEKASSICSPEQIVVTGLPRYDAWLDVDTSRTIVERRYVTLLTFSQGYYADQTFREVLTVFLQAAKEHAETGVGFLIKTKDAADSFFIRGLLEKLDLSNVQIDHEIALFDALPNSRLVINYNSLSLVEAAIARAPIMVPAWGECLVAGADVMYCEDDPVVSSIVTFSKTAREMLDVIADAVSGHGQLLKVEAASAFVNNYVYMPADGTISGEFQKFLEKWCGDGPVAMAGTTSALQDCGSPTTDECTGDLARR